MLATRYERSNVEGSVRDIGDASHSIREETLKVALETRIGDVSHSIRATALEIAFQTRACRRCWSLVWRSNVKGNANDGRWTLGSRSNVTGSVRGVSDDNHS